MFSGSVHLKKIQKKIGFGSPSWIVMERKAPAEVPRKKSVALAPPMPLQRHKGPLKPMKNLWKNPIFLPNLSQILWAFSPFLEDFQSGN